MTTSLTKTQVAVLTTLATAGGASPEELAAATSAHLPEVAATLTYLAEQGWVEVTEEERLELGLARGAGRLLDGGLPERRFLAEVASTPEDTPMPLREAAARAKDLGLPFNEVLKWGTHRGWFRKDKGALVVTDAGRAALETPAPDEVALLRIRDEGPRFLDELAAAGLDAGEIERHLARRPKVARLRPRRRRHARLTPAGRRLLDEGVAALEWKNQLTTEDLRSGAWRRVQLRPYDVTLPAEKRVTVKLHPFRRILDEVRRAFLEMGFTEIVSPMAESAFWNFDALFQPQDHPARDMQDTFYLKNPAAGPLPDPDLVDAVRRTHETGGTTGSTGWGYRWRLDRARRMVMRTHTTASTVRALAEHPEPPHRVFCVGRVFRNETISYKHLPEFTQVDGIVIDHRGSLAALLGTLTAFYQKMGFERIKFKPAFFPYTEPSVEVFVYFDRVGRWIELGGAGLFRPEVTEPLGCRVPVLAWGLGLERLAMLRYDVADIRTLYWPNLDWLEEVPLCR